MGVTGAPERTKEPPHRHPVKAHTFASSSLLALFGGSRKAPKINDLQPPKDATVATNADQTHWPPQIPESRTVLRECTWLKAES